MTTARRQVHVGGHPDDMVAQMVRLIGASGAAGLELAYDRHDGPPLADGEQPSDDDAVEWTVKVTFRDRSPITATHVVQPGKSHATGPVYALANVIEQLGGNVILVDLTDRTDPRSQAGGV